MRILIDNSGYHLENLGDVAMLQVGVRRMRALWPQAELWVITSAPARLEKFCPGATAVPVWEMLPRKMMATDPRVLTPWFRKVHWRLRSCQDRLEKLINRHAPALVYHLLRRHLQDNPGLAEEMVRLDRVLRQCDLVLVTGGGFLTDTFLQHAQSVLYLLLCASNRGIPIALLGQGIGPVEKQELRELMTQIIPRLCVLGLRERLGIHDVMDGGAGAPNHQVTGDDAIELAYQLRSAETGACLGLNLRQADYSGMSTDLARNLIAIVAGGALQFKVPVQILPISKYASEDDAGVCQHGIPDDVRVITLAPDTPENVIRAAAQCRMVVTGSYHAAVFSLAQGIPVIGLAKSSYYVGKFRGLADQFGDGCRWIDLSDADWNETLPRMITETYANSAVWRAPLLRAAERQIAAGNACYQRLFDNVTSR